jgi:CheY-like chemotaxis protein
MPKEMRDKGVLLVDDSENDARLLAAAFNRLGLTNPIIWLSRGEQAIAYLAGEGEYADRDRSPFPSVLILDLRMPGMDGFAVLEWIREHPELRRLFVVALSALDDTKSMNRAYELGANSYLTKPVDPDELLNMVRFFRGYWTTAPEVNPGNEKWL